jgi:hypothetical protein
LEQRGRPAQLWCAAISGLLGLEYLVFPLQSTPGWLWLVVATFCFVWFLFEGFHTWRLQPGTAAINYGWGRLAKLGFRREFVDVTSVRYECQAWDNAEGAWHNVELVSSRRKPQLIVSRTSHGPLRNQQTISSSADPNLVQELVAVAQLFAEALGVPIRVLTFGVRSPDPWWARGD